MLNFKVAIFPMVMILTSASAHATDGQRVEVQAVPGHAVYEYLAKTCSDASWKTVLPRAKQISLEQTEFKARSFFYKDRTVLSNDRKLAVTLTGGDQVSVDAFGKNYKGSVCDVIAQMAMNSTERSASLYRFLIPSAKAQELATEISADEYGQAAFSIAIGAGIGWMVAGPAGPVGALVGGGIGGVVTGAFLATRYSQIKENRSQLDTEISKIISADDLEIVNCSPTTIQLKGANKMINIAKQPKVAVRITGDSGPTGLLTASNSNLAASIAIDYSSCRSPGDANSRNLSIQRNRETYMRRVQASGKRITNSRVGSAAAE